MYLSQGHQFRVQTHAPVEKPKLRHHQNWNEPFIALSSENGANCTTVAPRTSSKKAMTGEENHYCPEGLPPLPFFASQTLPITTIATHIATTTPTITHTLTSIFFPSFVYLVFLENIAKYTEEHPAGHLLPTRILLCGNQCRLALS